MVFSALTKRSWDGMTSAWYKIRRFAYLFAAITHTKFGYRQLYSRKSLLHQYLVMMLLPFAMLCNKPRPSIVQQSRSAHNSVKKQSNCFDNINGIYTEQGEASWYGGNDDGFAGKMTASCEIYDPLALTCAHRILPFNTLLKVENIATGRNSILRVNDRGPFVRDRILDVSKRAAQDLGLSHIGIAIIRLQTVNSKGIPTPVNISAVRGDFYTIQVAAFFDPTSAKRLTKELVSNFDQKVYRVKQTSNGATIERVRIGAYPNLEQAEKTYRKLAKFCKERKLEPFIIRQH